MKTKLPKKSTLIITAIVTTISTAHAELPAPAQAAVDSISTFADDIINVAWPIAATILAASVGIKLFKKFVNKAS